MYYVYVYLDPRKPGKFTYSGLGVSFLYEPFYVGKGKGRRCFDHLWECKQGNNYKDRKLRKLLSMYTPDYLRSYIEIVKYANTDEAILAEEQRFISSIGKHLDKTGPLTNVTDGGKGNTSPRSAAFRKAHSNCMTGAANPASKITDTITLYKTDSAVPIGITPKDYYNKSYTVPLTQEQIRNLLYRRKTVIKGYAIAPLTPKPTKQVPVYTPKPKLWEMIDIYMTNTKFDSSSQLVTSYIAKSLQLKTQFVREVLEGKRSHHRGFYFSYEPIKDIVTLRNSQKRLIPGKARKGSTNGRAKRIVLEKEGKRLQCYGNLKQTLQHNKISDTFKLVNGNLINNQGWKKYYE